MALTALLETCRRLGLSSDWLLSDAAESDLERAVLEEAIRLRDAKQFDASLQLLDAAIEQGIRGGWLDDNRARALHGLGRLEEARQLWAALRHVDDLTLQAVAEQMLQQLALDEQLVEHLRAVETLAQRHHWSLRRLSEQQASASAFEFALLEEVILAREKGALSFSLELVELAIEAGFSSPWLLDNKARALVGQDQILEACRLWRELAEREDLEEMRPVAESMLRTYQRQEEQALKCQAERQWLDKAEQLQQSDLSAAVQTLVKGLGEFPDSHDIETRLLELLDNRRSQDDPDWSSLSPWLRDQELALECHEEVLQDLERSFSELAIGLKLRPARE